MVVAFFCSTIFSVLLYRFVPVYVTPLMLIRGVQQVTEGKDFKIHHKWVPLDEMPVNMVKAVIASEDAHFLEHSGFDFDAISKAIERNKKKNSVKFGGSTISQQTAKNVFLWPSRTWLRKGLEAYFTVLIELVWGKERIMEVYLNSIEMGDGIYGVNAIANDNFKCSPKDLSRRQCALVAAILPSPLTYSSLAPGPYVRKRQARILKEMKFVDLPNDWFDE